MSDTQAVKTRLYLLQHGSAVSKDADSDRPLSAEGDNDIRRLAERMANGVIKSGMDISHVFHSGKLRAEQTARIIADCLEPAINPEPVSGISPNDSAEAFIKSQEVGQEAGKGNILIVSHMPFVSNLCATLLTGSIELKFDFTPGTLVCLLYEYDEWSMEFMIRPETY